MKKQNGFTLIELMVVVSIIGILAAVAIPIYQRYVIRSQITEGLTLSGSAKSAIGEYYVENGTWPADNFEAGIADKDEFVGLYTAQVEVKNNRIEIQYGLGAHAAISGELVALIAKDKGGSLSWSCDSVIEDKLLPDACR